VDLLTSIEPVIPEPVCCRASGDGGKALSPTWRVVVGVELRSQKKGEHEHERCHVPAAALLTIWIAMSVLKRLSRLSAYVLARLMRCCGAWNYVTKSKGVAYEVRLSRWNPGVSSGVETWMQLTYHHIPMQHHL
jgi:hypothetical protein